MVDFTTGFGNLFGAPLKAYRQGNNGPQSPAHSSGASSSSGVAIGKALGKMSGSLTKGMLIDLPVALTGGLRNVPSLYGEKVAKHRQVDDWKSGASIAERFVSRLSQVWLSLVVALCGPGCCT